MRTTTVEAAVDIIIIPAITSNHVSKSQNDNDFGKVVDITTIQYVQE